MDDPEDEFYESNHSSDADYSQSDSHEADEHSSSGESESELSNTEANPDQKVAISRQ